MPKVRVKLNRKAVSAELLKNHAVAGMCMSIANQMASSAGPGYATREVSYPERTGAIVYPKNERALRDNYKNNTLEKARGGHYNG